MKAGQTERHTDSKAEIGWDVFVQGEMHQLHTLETQFVLHS